MCDFGICVREIIDAFPVLAKNIMLAFPQMVLKIRSFTPHIPNGFVNLEPFPKSHGNLFQMGLS